MEDVAVSASVFQGIKEFKLSNGLACYIKEQHEVPNIAVAIAYRVGSYDESDGIRGASHVLEHMMFKTTKKFKVGDIDKIAFEGGGMSNAYTSSDATVYYFKVNSDALYRILEAEAERMTNLTIVPEEFERERKVVLEELNRQQDSPWGKLYDEIHKLMFKEVPFKHPVIGYREELEKLTAERLLEHYKRFYLPSNATLVIIGDVDADHAVKRIEEIFADKPMTSISAPEVTGEKEQTGFRESTTSLSGEVARGIIGFKTDSVGSKVDTVCELLETLLTGTRTAILNKVIVHDRKLVREGGIFTYNFSEPFKGGSLQILYEPNSGVDVKMVAEETIKTISEYADQITEEDLRKAKNVAQSRFVYSNEALPQLVLNVAHMAAIGKLEHYTQYVDKIESVTLQDVRDVIKQYLTHEKASLVAGIPANVSETSGGAGSSTDNKRGNYRHFRRHFFRQPSVPPVEWQDKKGTSVDEIARRIKSYDIGAVWKIRLDNGLTFVLKPLKTLPIVNIRVFLEISSADDPEGKEGLASITGSMLDEGISDGIKDWDYQTISDFIEGKGSELHTSTDGFSIRSLSKYVDPMLEITRDLLLYATFPADRLERVKNDTLSEIKSRMDVPKSQLFDGFREAVYQGTQLSHPEVGYPNTVSSITRDHVVDFYRKHYRPDNTTMVICGNFDPYETLKRLNIYLSEWSALDNSTLTEGEFIQPVPKTKKVIIEKDTLQANILLGHLGVKRDNPDYYRLRVLETILGRGPLFYDRLSKEIREKNGLAYEVWGMLTSDADKYPGTVMFYTGTELKNKEKASKMAVEIINEFVENGPTVEELAGAKEYLLRGMFSQWETIGSYTRYLLNTARFGKPFDYYKEAAESIRSFELDDAKKLIRKYLRPEEFITVIVSR